MAVGIDLKLMPSKCFCASGPTMLGRWIDIDWFRLSDKDLGGGTFSGIRGRRSAVVLGYVADSENVRVGWASLFPPAPRQTSLPEFEIVDLIPHSAE